VIGVSLVEVIASVGAVLAGVAAAVVAVGVLARSPLVGKPLRWLWRTNVAGPVGEWGGQIVSDVVDTRIEHLMSHRNGGSSLLDLAEAVKKNQVGISRLDKKMTTSLDHDRDRDQPGLRYGADTEQGDKPS